jgi:hypothetical protein
MALSSQPLGETERCLFEVAEGTASWVLDNALFQEWIAAEVDFSGVLGSGCDHCLQTDHYGAHRFKLAQEKRFWCECIRNFASRLIPLV